MEREIYVTPECRLVEIKVASPTLAGSTNTEAFDEKENQDWTFWE